MTTERRDSAEKPAPRPERIGRGTAVGYMGAYHEPGTVDIEEVVALQNARGPE